MAFTCKTWNSLNYAEGFNTKAKNNPDAEGFHAKAKNNPEQKLLTMKLFLKPKKEGGKQ